ncbi:hypothetical protein C8F04DRAFT_1150594 [Mycena alexandri]|uniref:Secreted protein n=1 Tax=Mycena alexandri TaxID=1745969 RepID=A0AAD6S0I4_9AGAR|nr:hypothetical protein C8F04DRAFT_1150594 [Mycena alexandri]
MHPTPPAQRRRATPRRAALVLIFAFALSHRSAGPRRSIVRREPCAERLRRTSPDRLARGCRRPVRAWTLLTMVNCRVETGTYSASL